LAEAKPKELVEVINYIFEKEKNLSRYSDKLRQSWVRIANVFGSKKECQVCSGYENAKQHHHYRFRVENKFFSTKEDAFKYAKTIEPNCTPRVVPENFDPGRWKDPENKIIYVREIGDTFTHKFKPKIEVSIDIVDEQPFYEDEENKYYLAIIDHELKISEIPVAISKPQMYKFTWPMWNAPRWLLKQLTKSGRLPHFLKYVAQKLEKMESEYREVAEIAEKLAKALQ